MSQTSLPNAQLEPPASGLSVRVTRARGGASLVAALATVVVVALLGAPAAALPADEPLATDRPDIPETSTVVGNRRFQIETGVLREYASRGRRDRRSLLTPTLLRFGFHDRWEARLETDGFSRDRTFSPASGVSRTAGYGALAPGLKYHIQDPREGSCRPSLGTIFHLNVPSGSGDFRARKLTGDVKLAADWELSEKWSLGMNAGVAVDEDDTGEAYTSGLLTASLARSLTSKLRTYAELAFQTVEASGGRPGLIFDGGFAYLLNNDTQLDLGIGTGLAGRTTPDVFWTIGFSRRF